MKSTFDSDRNADPGSVSLHLHALTTCANVRFAGGVRVSRGLRRELSFLRCSHVAGGERQTTQSDLLQLFGGPDISTVDNEGLETLVYERSVTQTDASSRNQSCQVAANLGVFFGQVSAGAQGGSAQSSAASSTPSSFRSLTVRVKFGPTQAVVKVRFDNVYDPLKVLQLYKRVWHVLDKKTVLDKSVG